MTYTVAYDTPEEEERGRALDADKVFAGLDLDKHRIDVWWTRERNRGGVMTEAIKTVGGRGAAGMGGSVALSLTNCRELRRLFGDDLEISEALDEWAWAEIDRIGNVENFAEADSDAPLDPAVAEQAPAIASIAHPYQRAGVAFCATTRRALLADEPGLGKTLQSVGAVIAAGITGDILVLAPSAAVAITWPDELGRWVPDEEVVTVMGTGPQRHRIFTDAGIGVGATGLAFRRSPRRWIVINLEMARAVWTGPRTVQRRPKNQPTAPKRWIREPGFWEFRFPELQNHEWASVIVDESHRALITTNAHLQGQTQVRAGIAQLTVTEGGLKLALSGTPMRGKPENLWGTLNWLYPERYSSFWSWAQQWFQIFGDPAQQRGVEIGALDISKAAQFYADIRPIMLRRTKREVRPELPSKLYAGVPLALPGQPVDENSPVGHWLHMDRRQAIAYENMRDYAETQLDSGILVANGVLAELTRLKQFATTYGDLETKLDADDEASFVFKPQMPSAKFDWLLEFLAERGIEDGAVPDAENEQKVVVASQFTSVLNLYQIELEHRGIATLKITGGVKPADRKAAAAQWQAPGGPRVFLLNVQAGGVSLTLDAADDLVFLDQSWVPDTEEQVEDRIHRVSRMHQVTIHYLRTLGTIEENIAFVSGSRERLTKRLIDGERGVGFAKRLLTPIVR